MRIKNWDEFQHYRTGKNATNPTWIRLYRKILDDIEWHRLGGDDAKALIMIWLIASENEGELPPMDVLAFRLRIKEKELQRVIGNLGHFLEGSYDFPRTDVPRTEERRGEKRREEENYSVLFESFWRVYPRRIGKRMAYQAWQKALKRADAEPIIDGARRVAGEVDRGRELRYVKHPSRWLNADGWLDEREPDAIDRWKQINDIADTVDFGGGPSNRQSTNGQLSSDSEHGFEGSGRLIAASDQSTSR